MAVNKIKIVSGYEDKSSEKIKASFDKSKKSAVDLSKEFKSLKRSISTSMLKVRKSIEVNLQKSSVAQKKHAKELAHHTRFMGMSIGKLAGQIGSMRNFILVWMFALRPLINIIKSTTEAMTKQEDALKRLNYAMGIQGTQSKVVNNRLIEMSKGFQAVTRYGDEAVLEVMEKLITLGRVMPNQLERATQAVLDFSSASGRDLSMATLLIAKAATGFTGELSRYGIKIDENIPKTKKFSAVLEFIEKQMGGRAQQDIDSYGGKIKLLGNQYSDLKEKIGLTIWKYGGLNAAVEKLLKTFRSWNEHFEKEDPLDNAIFKAKKQIKVLEELDKKMTGKRPMKLLYLFPIGEIDIGIKKSRTRIESLYKFIDAAEKKKIERKIGSDVIAMAEKEKQIKMQAEEDFQKAYDNLASRKIETAIKTLEEEYAFNKKYVDDKIALEYLYSEKKKAIDAMVLANEKKNRTLAGRQMVKFMETYAKGMERALSEGFFKVVKGEFEGLKDVVISFGDLMLKTLIQIAVKMAMIKAWAGFGPLLGINLSTAATAATKTVNVLPATGHSGGVVRKYHSGGEVNATLLEGEGVLNRNAMSNLGVDNLNKLNSGEDAGGKTVNNYYIQTIDERSFRERLQQNGDIYANASEQGIRDNTSLRRTSQRFG